jgi:hypothetical protein
MHLKLISLLGLFTMIALAWACSLNRKQFPWRTVWTGLALQLAFALAILKTDFGARAFGFANAAVTRLLSFANEGAGMVFGPLAKGRGKRRDLRRDCDRDHYPRLIDQFAALPLWNPSINRPHHGVGHATSDAHQRQ